MMPLALYIIISIKILSIKSLLRDCTGKILELSSSVREEAKKRHISEHIIKKEEKPTHQLASESKFPPLITAGLPRQHG